MQCVELQLYMENTAAALGEVHSHETDENLVNIMSLFVCVSAVSQGFCHPPLFRLSGLTTRPSVHSILVRVRCALACMALPIKLCFMHGVHARAPVVPAQRLWRQHLPEPQPPEQLLPLQ